MPINIYAIKHPLIFTWVNHLIHNNPKQSDKYELIYKINSVLIYETCRKTISNYNLYIRYIDHMQEIWLIKSKQINIFCTDDISKAISKDILYLLPQAIIHPITIQDKNGNYVISVEKNYLSQNIENSHIIIIQEELLANKITSILKCINAENLINTKTQICCTYCNSIELDKLGQKYSQIDIYTAYISNTLNKRQIIKR